jgi:hypothetical protein
MSECRALCKRCGQGMPVICFLSDPKLDSDFYFYPRKLVILIAKLYSETAIFTFQKSGLKPPTSVGKDFNCAPQAL